MHPNSGKDKDEADGRSCPPSSPILIMLELQGRELLFKYRELPKPSRLAVGRAVGICVLVGLFVGGGLGRRVREEG